ncbi:MAG: hypothetical protein GTN69_03040 [Armatimonadetes bacterium]|nr:hypothetical protein [Armatimonadota bacterium]
MARGTMLGLSGLLWAVILFCYWRQPDCCAALIIWPRWVWLGPGLLLGLLGWNRKNKIPGSLVLLLWLCFLLLVVEEPRSLVRFRTSPAREWQEAKRQGQALRVISLNCAGETKAANEVAAYTPDIVLLQESPRQREVTELAKRFFGREGESIWGPDCSIIVRGRILSVHVSPSLYFVRAHLLTASGIEAEAISTRFSPAVLDSRLWTTTCWRDHSSRRRVHREQMQKIAQELVSIPETIPLIVGGDFNTPSGDAIFRLLQPRLSDTFREGGKGWGNTVVNDMPVARIDQVWTSDHFRAARVVAEKTRYSDHRMVICDLLLLSHKSSQPP